MTMTNHARKERHDRIYLINNFIGIGNPVKEVQAKSKKTKTAKAILTDTGIIVVKDRQTIITMIVPTLKYVKINFYPDTVIPWELQKAIVKNSQYIPAIEAMEALG